MQIEPAPNGVVPEFRSSNLEPGLSGTTPRSCAVRGALVCRQWAYLVGKPRTVGLATDPFSILAHLPRSCGSGPSRDRVLKLLGDTDRRIREDPEKVRAEINAYLLRFASRPLPPVRTAARRPSERQPRCRRSSRCQRRSTAGGGGGGSGDGSTGGGSGGDDDGSSGDPDHLGWPAAAAVPLGGRRGR